MIKLKITTKNEGEVAIKYNQIGTNTAEHIAGIVALYRTIKENTDYTDDELIKDIYNVYKKVEGNR